MKIYIRLIYISFFALIISCIDPYDPLLVGTKKRLVFDGYITNQEGPFQIQLTFTAGYNSKESIFDSYVLGAKVWITDEKNIRTDLLDQNFGYFLTPSSFKGQIGKSYKINFKLSDGREYESSLETMKPVSEIDKVYSEFKINTNPQPTVRGNFDVFLDTKDPATIGDFYRWKWKHYDKLASCLLYTVPRTDPPVRLFRRCCTECWSIDQCFGCVSIASDNFINGKSLVKQKVAEIPYDSEKPYYLMVEQMSLSREGYDFFKTLDEQANNSGGIFDVAPGTLRGNIKNLKDPEDPAIGFFQVSSVSQKIVYVRRDKVSVPPFTGLREYPFDTVCQTCNEGLFRTGKKPPQWVD